MIREMVTSAERYIESLELFGMQFGLERMQALLEKLGHPERRYDAIHVVGSNGKSSTVRFAEALLEAEGIRTGAYLSPHLTTFRERIRIGGQTISEPAYERAVHDVMEAVGDGVTQFEALTAAALQAFAQAGVQWAVVEAGLGGRLDATNVLSRSRVQVLTNVSLEHSELLGDTREKIAAEKLAVVPRGGTVISGEEGWDGLVPQARSVTVTSVGGSFQDQNRAVAEAAVEAALGRPVDASGLSRITVPGRFEIRGRDPLEIWDGAHNPAGMQRLVAELPAVLGDRQAVAVFSALEDKDVATMVSLLRTVCPTIVGTSSSNPRSMPAEAIGRLTGGAVADEPQEALEAARLLAGGGGAVVVCGSLYLLHDLAEQQA
jgi:dihydrofolate synthase / folylpolyglutamate synthase